MLSVQRFAPSLLTSAIFTILQISSGSFRLRDSNCLFNSSSSFSNLVNSSSLLSRFGAVRSSFADTIRLFFSVILELNCDISVVSLSFCTLKSWYAFDGKLQKKFAAPILSDNTKKSSTRDWLTSFIVCCTTP